MSLQTAAIVSRASFPRQHSCPALPSGLLQSPSDFKQLKDKPSHLPLDFLHCFLEAFVQVLSPALCIHKSSSKSQWGPGISFLLHLSVLVLQGLPHAQAHERAKKKKKRYFQPLWTLKLRQKSTNIYPKTHSISLPNTLFALPSSLFPLRLPRRHDIPAWLQRSVPDRKGKWGGESEISRFRFYRGKLSKLCKLHILWFFWSWCLELLCWRFYVMTLFCEGFFPEKYVGKFFGTLVVESVRFS